MLINKWLITKELIINNRQFDYTGICFPVSSEVSDISNLYISVQQMSDEISFSLLFSGEYFKVNEENKLLIQKVIGLFFMPAYYLLNYEPILFIKNETEALYNFLGKLTKECKKQGVRGLVVKKLEPNNTEKTNEFVCFLDTGRDFNLDAEFKKWVNENIEGNNPPEINLLIPDYNKGYIVNVSESEKKLRETEVYNIADAFYQKQRLLDETNHSLYLKAINEKNVRFYLSIQKEERAKGLKYYYYEYEILPKWYKQFGHIIKVIMGKRTFKSLFNDNVKKYKD